MKTTMERFNEKFRVDDSGCWIWTAGKKGGGYGVFYFNGRLHGAHRVALHLYRCEDLSTSKHAMHSCDNPACVNPAHLSLGTATENMRDAAAKGRTVRVGDWNGQRNPKSKLSPAQRQQLEALLTTTTVYSRKELADRFSITPERVWQIHKEIKARAKKDGGGWQVEEF
jgi:hypothetical protein